MYLNPNPTLRALAKRVLNYSGTDFRAVPVTGQMTMPSYWDEGTRDYYAIIRADGQSEIVPENGGLSRVPVHTVLVTPGMMVLELHHYGSRSYLTIYCHPDHMPKLIDPPPDLTWPEKVVLCATRSLKSSYGGVSNYRFVEARRETGISLHDWGAAKEALIEKGLLGKNGAITPNGKNAIGSIQLYSLRKEN